MLGFWTTKARICKFSGGDQPKRDEWENDNPKPPIVRMALSHASSRKVACQVLGVRKLHSRWPKRSSPPIAEVFRNSPIARYFPAYRALSGYTPSKCLSHSLSCLLGGSKHRAAHLPSGGYRATGGYRGYSIAYRRGMGHQGLTKKKASIDRTGAEAHRTQELSGRTFRDEPSVLHLTKNWRMCRLFGKH